MGGRIREDWLPPVWLPSLCPPHPPTQPAKLFFALSASVRFSSGDTKGDLLDMTAAMMDTGSRQPNMAA